MWRQLTFDKNNGEKYTTGHPEVDLMDLLVAKTEALGHMLNFSEAAADPDMVVPNSYAYYFGSFSEAARQAWQKVRLASKNSVLTEDAYKLINSDHKLPREGVKHMGETTKSKRGGKKPQYSIAELEAKLKDFYTKNGRLPTQTDVRKYDSGLPAWATMIKFLGPKSEWSKIVSEETTVEPEVITSETTEPETIDLPIDIVDDPICDDTINEVIEAAYGTDGKDGVIESISQTIHDSSVNIEIKITLPDREKPVFINLTI